MIPGRFQLKVEIVEEFGDGPFLFAQLSLHFLPSVSSDAQASTSTPVGTPGAEDLPQIGNCPLRRHSAAAVHHYCNGKRKLLSIFTLLIEN